MNGGTFITRCRFGFPRQECDRATLLTVDQCMKLSHTKMYNLVRACSEIRINNYNPLLLMLWKANMDIQYVSESTLAIAHVTEYVTKAERSNMQDLWQEVSSHNSIYSRLWSFGVRSMRSRECGLYEASDILLGDHLCGKSRTVKWLDVSRPDKRKRRLMDHSKLSAMKETNPQSTDIFEDNVVDTFYPQRPRHMEDVCLFDFVAEYTKCGVDKDGKAVYRKLCKPVLPNHKIYNPNKEPFRREGNLIVDGENAFNWHMQNNDAMNTHSEKLQRMLKSKERVQKINEARQAREENVVDNKPVEVDDGPQVVGEATAAMNDVYDLHHNNDGDAPNYEELVCSLNADQGRVLEQIKSHLEHQAFHEKKTSPSVRILDHCIYL